MLLINYSLSLAYQALGLSYKATYTSDDYKAHIQNWGFIQDDNGNARIKAVSGFYSL